MIAQDNETKLQDMKQSYIEICSQLRGFEWIFRNLHAWPND